MVKVGIIGVTGYTGIELLRLLHLHPHVSVTQIVTDSYVGEEISNVYPHLTKQIQMVGEKLDVNHLSNSCDLVFIALPSGHAEQIVPALLEAHIKVIDLGSDYRATAVYGLPEIPGARKQIQSSMLIANPGCYPTAALLATLPALQSEIIQMNDIIFDAKSGISGAGRSLSLRGHFCEMSDNLVPYHLAGAHRHTGEIEHALSKIANQSITVQFSPHILPIIRGLTVTAYFKLKNPMIEDDVYAIYEKAYSHERFIRLRRRIPEIKHVRGTQYCDMSLHVDSRTQRLIVVSVIDNLMKGASGQAVQNMNLMCDFPEHLGLDQNIAIYP